MEDQVPEIGASSFKSLAEKRRQQQQKRSTFSSSPSQADSPQVVNRRRSDSLTQNAQRPSLSSLMVEPQLQDLFFTSQSQRPVSTMSSPVAEDPMKNIQALTLDLAAESDYVDADIKEKIADLNISDVLSFMMSVDDQEEPQLQVKSVVQVQEIIEPIEKVVTESKSVRVQPQVQRQPPFVLSSAFEYKVLELLDDALLELLDIQFTATPDASVLNTATQFYPYGDNFLDMEPGGQIKAAKLPCLVDAIIKQECENAGKSELDTFLMTYLNFAVSLDVARLMVLKYLECSERVLVATATLKELTQSQQKRKSLFFSGPAQQSPQQQEAQAELHSKFTTQLTIQKIFRKWIESDHFEEFQQNQPLCKLVVKFVQHETSVDSKKMVYLQPHLSKLEQVVSGKPVDPVMKQDKLVCGPTTCELSPITAINADNFVKELSLVEQELYCSVRLSELFQQQWNHKDKAMRELNCSNLLAFCNFFNRIAYGVATQVISVPKIRDRVETLKTFIYIAHECAKIKNYNSCFEIVAGLNLGAVSRMKQTWKQLPKKYADAWAQLNQLVTNQGNYKLFRVSMASNEGALVPYLGMFLSDLTFIEDGNPTYLNGMVNFGRCLMIAEVLRKIMGYQQKRYSFESKQELRSYILQQWKVISESDMYAMSKKNEPPQGQESAASFGTSISNLLTSKATSPTSPISAIANIKSRVRAISVSSSRNSALNQAILPTTPQ